MRRKIKKSLYFASATLLLIAIMAIFTPLAFGQNLSETQKESIGLIKTLSLQFLLFGAGIFSLTVIYLIQNPSSFPSISIPIIILISYIFFGASIYFGYKVWGNIIWQLKGDNFDPFNEILVNDAKRQFYSFFIGSFILFSSIVVNMILTYCNRNSNDLSSEMQK
jgi:hypothetical protein